MQTLIATLAWTSLIVSSIPNILNIFKLFLWLIIGILDSRHVPPVKIGTGFFVWLALGVWPIVYFIIS